MLRNIIAIDERTSAARHDGRQRLREPALAALSRVAQPDALAGLPDVLAALANPKVRNPIDPSAQLPGRIIRSAHEWLLPYFCLTGHSSRRALWRVPLSGQVLSGAMREFRTSDRLPVESGRSTIQASTPGLPDRQPRLGRGPNDGAPSTLHSAHRRRAPQTQRRRHVRPRRRIGPAADRARRRRPSHRRHRACPRASGDRSPGRHAGMACAHGGPRAAHA